MGGVRCKIPSEVSGSNSKKTTFDIWGRGEGGGGMDFHFADILNKQGRDEGG
jgi:hypothetical protein